jgi:hypothetical protein
MHKIEPKLKKASQVGVDKPFQDTQHSSHATVMASAYEHSVAHTKQDFHTGVKSSRMKSTKE